MNNERTSSLLELLKLLNGDCLYELLNSSNEELAETFLEKFINDLENDQLMNLVGLDAFKKFFKLRTKVSDKVKEAILDSPEDFEFNPSIIESFIDYAVNNKIKSKLIEKLKKNQTVEAVYNNQKALLRARYTSFWFKFVIEEIKDSRVKISKLHELVIKDLANYFTGENLKEAPYHSSTTPIFVTLFESRTKMIGCDALHGFLGRNAKLDSAVIKFMANNHQDLTKFR